ncbi:hypothetical protein K469DRAFT_647989 [Zopfia rhizophila CBS 207.26]|uniref:Uncharacterized protein n=1 Tax=Zopfia rhizophila CBS 207.26 TaxID=1314779 RepID=A0A6A6D5N5_9PEZI|nr:hypothetical protein K469DRAFT_647989 [Zopfia rhizophila CBS 207.26]
MVQVHDLTVGYVSGMIAAGLFVVQLLIAVAIPFVLVGLLKEKNSKVTASAVTWSVIGRLLHSSYWPTILQTDSATNRGVRSEVWMLSWLQTLATVLVAITGVVTPLGLYEGVGPAKTPSQQVFHYLQDTSPFVYGTLARNNLPWSRICGSLARLGCPGSPNNVTIVSNKTGNYVQADWYNSHVPQNVIDVFQSGLSTMNKTVSSVFDIQWRSYTLLQPDDRAGVILIDNGTAYPVGTYEHISTITMDDQILLVEGLIVDTRDGGIGFRNHSAPPPREYASTWSEDILFIQPQTQCVDTNLTLDFSISATTSIGTSDIANLVLTDRGGFSNIDHKYPTWEMDDMQGNPDLWRRAYKAAFLNNVYSMFFLNVTAPANKSVPGSHAFEYVNSFVGKTFPLQKNGSSPYSLTIETNKIMTSGLWGYYLEGTDEASSGSNSTMKVPPLYPNPFNITSSNFSDAVFCGPGGADDANIKNFATQCGLLYGAPRRQDGTDSQMSEPGSAWTIPMYSCVSAAMASVKTVSFRFNGSDGLSGLTVTNLVEKNYPNEDSKPLWAVENTGMSLSDVNPLWGLVKPESQGGLNLSTIRKESLMLPGFVVFGEFVPKTHQNLPGVDFYCDALGAMYDVGHDSDYSGESNNAMYRVWRGLSRTSTTAAKILNLIWTDAATNAVAGTRSIATSNESKAKRTDDSARSDANTWPVILYQREIKYHLRYAIPAVILLFVAVCMCSLMLCLIVFGRTGPSKMRKYLNKTSAGRVLAGHIYGPVVEGDGSVNDEQSSRKWVDRVGSKQITVGGAIAEAAETYVAKENISPDNSQAEPFLR